MRATVACRSNSSRRCSVSATEMLPTCRIPVATPVSASSFTYKSAEYFASRVMLADPRNCPISPAACHVVPDVSCFRSSSTTSVHPALAR